MTSSTFSLPQEALASGLLIRAKLDALLPPEDNNNSLYSAMRYSALSSGKALRGYLLMQVADSYGVVPAYSLQAAAAIEALHCYSLIHDDLPAMDDDAMRRLGAVHLRQKRAEDARHHTCGRGGRRGGRAQLVRVNECVRARKPTK